MKPIGQRSGGTLKSQRSKFAEAFHWKRAALCALAAAAFALPSAAQKGGPTGGGGANRSAGVPGTVPGGGGGFPSIYNPNIQPMPQPMPTAPPPLKPAVYEDEKCLPWNVSEGKDTAVSVTRLQLPPKARNEYEKACDSNNKGKFDDAEKHARAAIDKFQTYSAAWVLLGVILEEQKKEPEARDACGQAMKVDSKYSPAYLCQAEFLTRDQEWEQLSNLANMALGLNSAGDGYAYYYRAQAFFHTNNPAEAKKSALQSAEIDANHENVPLYFLLAQIYEAEGNKPEAVAQLRQVLKHHAGNKEQEDAAKQYIAQLESQPAPK